MRTGLDRLARREWWLWLSAIVTTLLAGAVFVLSVFHHLFTRTDHFYEVTVLQARTAAFELLLLFNAWMLYRLWSLRRAGRELHPSQFSGDAQTAVPQDSFRIDPVTGLCTRASFEYLLGKEVARSRRRKLSLSLVAVQLDDFAEVSRRLGPTASDAMAKEFASRLRRASRGGDFAVRLQPNAFLLALPECSLNDAKRVVDRLGEFEMKLSDGDINVTSSVGWIDYKPGEVPSDLIRRGEQLLQLYGQANGEGILTSRA